MSGDKGNGKANGHANGADLTGVTGAGSPVPDDAPSDSTGVSATSETELERLADPNNGDSAPSPMPPAVADLAAACVRFVTSRYGVPLDFSPDTLSLVDQYVRDSREELKARPEGLDLLAGTVGAYFGEVVRLARGGHWRADGDPSAWRVLMTHVFLAFNPVGMAREALTLEEAEGWGAFLQLDDAEREAVEARLLALPEVDEGEFYLPTTRFDVLEIAFATLRASMEASGLGSVRFGPDDYE